jgi:acyl carrier protein
MKFVKVFLIICVFWSCQNIKEIKKPDNLIPEDEMVEVLTELNLLNSAKNYNKRLLEKTGMQPDKYLYNKYDIDSLQLAESTTYYAKKYDKFDGIYQKVKQNLEAMKVKLVVIRDEEQRIEDSIRALDTLNLDSLQTPKPVLIDSLDLQTLKEGVY